MKLGVVRWWSVLVASLSSIAASAAPIGICDLARQRDGLYPYMVEGQSNADGVVEIAADIDGSGVVDKISWFRTGSASIVPPDYDRVTVTLSSNGKVFMVEGQRILLAKYRRKFYVVATSLSSDAGPWKRVVYSVGRKGIPKLCAFGGKGLGPDA